MDMQDMTKIREEILTTALGNVPFDGWSWKTLEESALQSGHERHAAAALFPDRLTGAAKALEDMADRWMMERLEKRDPGAMKVRERVRAGVLARFEALEPYKDAMAPIAAYWALPLRHLQAGKATWKTADKIWLWAGDTAKDYNYYTKRALLSGILVSSIFVWLGDDEQGLAKTKAFLDRRIENVMQFGKLIGRVQKR